MTLDTELTAVIHYFLYASKIIADHEASTVDVSKITEDVSKYIEKTMEERKEGTIQLEQNQILTDMEINEIGDLIAKTLGKRIDKLVYRHHRALLKQKQKDQKKDKQKDVSEVKKRLESEEQAQKTAQAQEAKRRMETEEEAKEGEKSFREARYAIEDHLEEHDNNE